MRVLVTGGAGFIGSHVVEALVDEGDHVIVLDEVLRPDVLPPMVEYHQGDVRRPEAWFEALPGVDAVCHHAAKVGLGQDVGDVVDYVDRNDAGMAAGLWTMHRVGFAGRVVLASSMTVYGEGAYRCPEHGRVRPGPRLPERLDQGIFDPPCPTCGSALAVDVVDEDAPLDPRNIYAATKLHQEHLCHTFGRETGATVLALRYHNVYGPRMPRGTPYAGVASIFASALAAGEPPHVFEDGRQRRDFVHVTDVARANVLALHAEIDGQHAFNIASGEARTVGDLANCLWATFGGMSSPPVVTGSWRPGDVRHVVASPARARQVLGFTACVSFDDGIAELAAQTPQVRLAITEH